VLDAKRGGERQREELIDSLGPSIAAVARFYRSTPGVTRSELMQEGAVGVLRALERYEPERGIPFWAYASWWVRQSMQQLVAELSRPLVLSDRALRELARIKQTRRTLEQSWGREPTSAEVTRAGEVPGEHVQRLMNADRAPRGLQEPVSEQSDGRTSLGDLLADPQAQDPFDRVLGRLCASQLPRLHTLLNVREAKVIRARFGIGTRQRTLGEVAESLGVSPERVRQIEKASLEKLHQAAL
jgi:RNA polymerase primary sigma factor